MRTTTPALPFQLSPDLKEDPWLPWLIEHAHPDLWMPRVPIAVIERIRRRFQGQKKTTLVNLWIGIRRLLVLYIKTGRNDFSVRDIASISGVSRSRLCGDKGFIQDLLDVGVIGVTVPAEPAYKVAQPSTRRAPAIPSTWPPWRPRVSCCSARCLAARRACPTATATAVSGACLISLLRQIKRATCKAYIRLHRSL